MSEISGKGVPSSKTTGAVGDYYIDTDTSLRYKCELAYASTDEDGKDIVYYKWRKVNSGSSSGGTTAVTPFLIDSTSSDYSMTSTSYGDKIKGALLSGCPVWYYGQETESGKTVSKYTQVTWFNIQQTDTEAKLIIGVGARSDGDAGGVAFTISVD